MKCRKTFQTALALALASSFVSVSAGAVLAKNQSLLPPHPHAQAKYVILMISDGMGGWHADATSKYLQNPLAMESLTHHGYMTTFMRNPLASSETGEYWHLPSEIGTYDPTQGGYTPWELPTVPAYVDSGATDSAAAASAMFTGYKIPKYSLNAIGKNDGYPSDTPFSVKYYQTIFELAETSGKATGLITSVNFNHATPASGVVKTQYRKNYGEKARQMIYSDIDVIMGAGHPGYDDNGVPLAEPNFYGFSKNKGTYLDDVDGEALYNLVTNDFKGRTFIDQKSDFEDLASGALEDGTTPARVFGLAQVANTLQYNRNPDEDQANNKLAVHLGGDPLNANVPTLQTMTEAALVALEQDKDGFVMMVEGGAIDWAGHGNNLARVLEENIDFDNAVQSVIDWVDDTENGSDWSNTLLIVTADHETGHLQPVGEAHGDEVFAAECWGVDCAGWGSHTNSLVPIYAQGGRAFKLQAEYLGDIRDNTDIYTVMATALNGKKEK